MNEVRSSHFAPDCFLRFGKRMEMEEFVPSGVARPLQDDEMKGGVESDGRNLELEELVLPQVHLYQMKDLVPCVFAREIRRAYFR